MLQRIGASKSELFVNSFQGKCLAHSLDVWRSDAFFPLYDGTHRYSTDLLYIVDLGHSGRSFTLGQLQSVNWQQFI